MKSFKEALIDGFRHIKSITDREELAHMRSEGIQVDQEGYYSFIFGDNKEYELRIEPILDENQYCVSLYKRGILLTQKLPVKGLDLGQ